MSGRQERGRRHEAAVLTKLVKAKGETAMSNQNFKIILTAPVSEMGQIISCATSHGGIVEMVEVEPATAAMPEPRQLALPTSINPYSAMSSAKVGVNGVTSLDVYRVFRDYDLGDSTATGIRKVLEASLGRKVDGSSVNAAIHRLNVGGFIHVTTPEKQRYRAYDVTERLSDERFVEEFRVSLQAD